MHLFVIGLLLWCLAAPLARAGEVTDALLDVKPKTKLSSPTGAAYGSAYGTGKKTSPHTTPLAINQVPQLPVTPLSERTAHPPLTQEERQTEETRRLSTQEHPTSPAAAPAPAPSPGLPSTLDRSKNLDTYNDQPFEATYNGQPLDDAAAP